MDKEEEELWDDGNKETPQPARETQPSAKGEGAPVGKKHWVRNVCMIVLALVIAGVGASVMCGLKGGKLLKELGYGAVRLLPAVILILIAGGIRYIVEQLKKEKYHRLHIVMGMVNDKDIRGVVALMPQEAVYYFTQASVKRAMPADKLKKLANEAGLQGECYADVPSAVRAAQKESLPEDFIFVGGSSFIVADLLANRNTLNLH